MPPAPQYYAGIGSRQTPPNIQTHMAELATQLQQHNYVVRSGGALGADRAFTPRHILLQQVFTPHSGLNWTRLKAHAATFHPNWPAVQRLGDFTERLHARNSAIMLGPDLDKPVRFVLCWTPQASGSGGTGQALRIARHHNIPIFDFFDTIPTIDELLTRFPQETHP